MNEYIFNDERETINLGLRLPYPNTFYKVQVKAHNDLGFSSASVIIIKTATGEWFLAGN